MRAHDARGPASLESRPDAPPARRLGRDSGTARRAALRLQADRNSQPGDLNRWETIARARNQGRTLGASPWVMCLDDDVVLEPDCLAQLVEGLQRRPEFAALAADSAGEMSRIWEHWDYPTHVGMA